MGRRKGVFKIPLDYNSHEWQTVRGIIFLIMGKQCQCCGSKTNLAIDHILPMSLYPKKVMRLYNFQVLCSKCNKRKYNDYHIDFRTPEQKERIKRFSKDNKALKQRLMRYGKQLMAKRIFINKVKRCNGVNKEDFLVNDKLFYSAQS